MQQTMRVMLGADHLKLRFDLPEPKEALHAQANFSRSAPRLNFGRLGLRLIASRQRPDIPNYLANLCRHFSVARVFVFLKRFW